MSLRKAGIDDINSIVKIEKISHEKPYWNESLLKYLFKPLSRLSSVNNGT